MSASLQPTVAEPGAVGGEFLQRRAHHELKVCNEFPPELRSEGAGCGAEPRTISRSGSARSFSPPSLRARWCRFRNTNSCREIYIERRLRGLPAAAITTLKQLTNNLAVSVAAGDLQFLENRWYVIHSHLVQTCSLSESCEESLYDIQ